MPLRCLSGRLWSPGEGGRVTRIGDTDRALRRRNFYTHGLEHAMKIEIYKFGKFLVSRPAGKEAAAIMLSSFKPKSDDEIIELDFTDIEVIGPPWLDEVLRALRDTYGASRVRCLESQTACVSGSH